MSRIFQNKNKDLSNLKVVSSKDVWIRKKNGKYIFIYFFNIFKIFLILIVNLHSSI